MGRIYFDHFLRNERLSQCLLLTSSIPVFLVWRENCMGVAHGPGLTFLVQLLNELNLGYVYLKVRFGLVWFDFFLNDLLI